MGTIQLHNTFGTLLEADRKIRVYLPKGYNENLDRSYPVLYMHDGQNVFTHDTATYGHSWGMKDTLDSMKAQIILVAIDNSKEHRYDEYSPWLCELPKTTFPMGFVYGGSGKFD